MHCPQRTRGFTLVETLVVVGIIGVLTAILLPVLAHVREKGAQASCLNNQRQIAATLLTYAQDHDQRLPEAATVWQNLILPPKSLICPTRPRLTHGYAYNGIAAGRLLTELRRDLSQTMLTADGASDGAIALTGHDLETRHQGKVIAAFADGHVLLHTAIQLLTGAAGTLYGCGDNTNGLLGIGNTSSQTQYGLVPIPGMTDVVSVSSDSGFFVAGGHTLAAKADGSVWAWGQNGVGQLGIQQGFGQATVQTTPVQVPGVSDIVMVAATPSISYALSADGTVWSWGGSITHLNPPKPMPISGVVFLSKFYGNLMALKADGTVWGSVDIMSGQQGIITGLNGVTAVAAGWHHDLALKSDGTVWAWGDNASGEIGNGKSGTGAQEPKPVLVPGLNDVVAIGAGVDSSFAVTSNGALLAWGANYYGQLGIGDQNSKNVSTPTQVTGVQHVADVVCNWNRTSIRTLDDHVWVCGQNLHGAFGLDSTAANAIPTPELIPDFQAITVSQGSDWCTYLIKRP